MNTAEKIDVRAIKIAALNDAFRATFNPRYGRVLMTRGVSELGDDMVRAAVSRVRRFSDFGHANDPYGEHDFGKFKLGDETLFWKIDYYAPDMMHGADDPADSEKTCRVLTIMLASEY